MRTIIDCHQILADKIILKYKNVVYTVFGVDFELIVSAFTADKHNQHSNGKRDISVDQAASSRLIEIANTGRDCD